MAYVELVDRPEVSDEDEFEEVVEES